VTIEAEGLLVTIRAIAGGLLRQQFVLVHEKGAVIVHDAGSAMALPAILRLGAPVFLVVGSGEGEADDPKQEDRGHQRYLKRPVV
jgi:hypothetical protein